MRETINLRFAMETWAITFQTLLLGPSSPSPSTLAKTIGRDCRLSFGDLALVQQVACSKHSNLGVFQLYVKFSFPPEPALANKILSQICLANNALYFSISDPMNYLEAVKLPYEQDESGLDLCLARIKENTPRIISNVATGMDLYVEEM